MYPLYWTDMYPLYWTPSKEGIFMISAYKPVLSTQGVRSIIHPLCGCATNVIQKNHLRVIMWLLKLHCNERKVTFMANKTNSLSHTKWMCKYHIVFSPKYRRKIIYISISQKSARYHKNSVQIQSS